MAYKVTANNFGNVLMQLLKEYGDDVNKVTADAVRTVAKETAKELKATAPVNKGAYAKSWSYKPEKVSGVLTEYVVYSKKPYYRLTHLLEDGHKIANGAGEYGGSVAARPHIAQAEQKAIEELEQRIREEIQRI